MSYGANTTVIELQRTGTTLILGEDLDNTESGAGANGVGKTVIINALAYAVYGKPVSNISLDNLVNNVNKKNMEVTVTFEKDGTYYHIQRVRKSKNYAAGNYVKFYAKEGSPDFAEEDEKTRDSVVNTNKVIENIINIPHDLFCRIVVFSALHIPFLDLPVRHPTQACQTRIIEELFDLTSLTEKAEILKQQIKENETRLEMKQVRVDQLEKEHERHQQQVDSLRKRASSWQLGNENQIQELEAKLEKIAGVNITQQRKAHELLIELEKEINTILSEQREVATVIKQLEKDVNKKEKELEHLSDEKCPYCLQKYPDADNKVKEIDKELKTKKSQVAALEQSIEELDEEEEAIAKKRAATKKKITVPNVDELVEIKSQSSAIKERIKELKTSPNPFIEPLDELEAVELDPIDKDEINNTVRVIEHQKFLYKLLTKKDSFVRKALLNKNIPYLNGKLQQYLNDLGLPHKVEFTHELTAQISQFGHLMEFGNLSNGQRARVNIALSLAFRDVLQNLHTKINVCMFDEVLDVGLDTIGVQAAARMLKRKARDEKLSLYIISHRDEIDKAFDHNMTVQLNGGFSFIKEE